MLLDDLEKKKLIHPPKFLANSTCYLTIMGSEAYGVSSGDSDKDIYGIAIPPKEDVFPHLKGEILGFGRQNNRFEVWQEHHCKDLLYEYDFSVYSIVRFFNLVMENNPNIIDTLFTPQRCVIHATKIGQHIRENRKMFLHKGCFQKFKGYSYSSLHKMNNKEHKGFDEVVVFEEKYGIDNKTTFNEVELEMKKRGLLSNI